MAVGLHHAPPADEATTGAPHPWASVNDTERRLLQSALSLFSEKGYDRASIREIIERAGVTRPVLYYYFENKEDLFRRLVETWMSEVMAESEQKLSVAVNTRHRLCLLVRHAFECAKKTPEAVRLLLQAFFTPQGGGPLLDKERLWQFRFGRIREIMAGAMEAGELRQGQAETLAMVFCGIMDLHVMAYCHDPATPLTDELADTLVDLFLNGAAQGATIVGALPANS